MCMNHTGNENNRGSERAMKGYSLFYHTLRCLSFIGLSIFFRPKALNKEYLSQADRVIISSNHMKTVDPMVLFLYLPRYVRWGALKRFFDAEDSFFENSKNPFLMKFTAWLFTRMGVLPVDREKNNLQSMRLFRDSLKAGTWVGLFPEGTTNKNPDTVVVQEPKDGVFLLAKVSKALVQPIALSWVSKEQRKAHHLRNKVLVNFRPAFEVDELDEAKARWLAAIAEGKAENQQYLTERMRIK